MEHLNGKAHNPHTPDQAETLRDASGTPAPATLLPAVLRHLGLDTTQPASPSSAQEALANLQSLDWQQRLQAVRTLGTLGQQAPRDPLLRALQDEDEAVRAAAIAVLAPLGEQIPLAPLVAALRDPAWQVRETAILALARHRRLLPTAVFDEALRDQDSTVREAAQLAIQWRRQPEWRMRSNELGSSPIRETGIDGDTSVPTANAYGAVPTRFPTKMQPQELYGKKQQKRMKQGDTMREQRSKPAMQDPEYDYYTYRNDEFNRHWEKVTSYTPRKNRKPLWFGIGSLIGVAILFIAGVSTWVLYTRNTPISQIDFAQPTLMPQATPASGYAPQTVNVYTNHHGPVNAVAWSPDGTRIASASDDMTVQVWDALTGNNPFIFSRHTAPVETLAWSPNGQLIASASLDGTIDVWDPNNGRLDLTYHFAQTADVAHIGALQAKSGGDPETFAVAWSHDGSTIAAVMGSSVVRVFDVHSGSTLYTIPQSSKVVAMAWSPNGKYIITADANSTTTIWNASNGTAAFGSMVSNTFVFSLSWSPDSKRVALSYIDGTVQICNPFSNSFLKLTTQSPIYSVAWSPNGARLALAGVDGTNATVQFVDTTSDQTTLVYSGYMNTLRDMAWSPNSSLLAFASSDATVQVWKVA